VVYQGRPRIGLLAPRVRERCLRKDLTVWVQSKEGASTPFTRLHLVSFRCNPAATPCLLAAEYIASLICFVEDNRQRAILAAVTSWG
jgi:hypothetical protein